MSLKRNGVVGREFGREAKGECMMIAVVEVMQMDGQAQDIIRPCIFSLPHALQDHDWQKTAPVDQISPATNDRNWSETGPVRLLTRIGGGPVVVFTARPLRTRHGSPQRVSSSWPAASKVFLLPYTF